MRKYYITILCGIFISLQIVLGRVLAVDVGFMRVSFIFVPIAIGGAIFGPMWNGVICAIADIAGFLLLPNGAFFPGFTLSAFLTGFTYGFFLKSPLPLSFSSSISSSTSSSTSPSTLPFSSSSISSFPSSSVSQPSSHSVPNGSLSSIRSLLFRTFCAAFCVTIIIDALINTLWVSILAEKAYMFYFATRLLKSTVMLPIHIVVFGVIWRSLGKYIESAVYPKIRSKKFVKA